MVKFGSDMGLLILRIGFSAMMLTHGIPKIKRLFADPIKFADPIGLGETLTLILTLIAEVVSPILIIIGLKTRLATIPPIIAMTVAAFVIHINDDFGTKEKALLFLFAFLTLLFTGPGKFSIDK